MHFPACTPQLSAILNSVAAEGGVTVEKLRSPSRKAMLVALRRCYCYRAFLETKASVTRIGAFINRDSTTAMHSISRYCVINNLPPPKGVKWTMLKKLKT